MQAWGILSGHQGKQISRPAAGLRVWTTARVQRGRRDDAASGLRSVYLGGSGPDKSRVTHQRLGTQLAAELSH